MTVLKKWKMVTVWYFLRKTQVVHLSVIIQIVLAAAAATSTMAYRVRVSVRVSVVYAMVYNFKWPYLSCSTQRTSWRHYIVIEYRLSVMCRTWLSSLSVPSLMARARLTANKRVEPVVSISWASCCNSNTGHPCQWLVVSEEHSASKLSPYTACTRKASLYTFACPSLHNEEMHDASMPLYVSDLKDIICQVCPS